jgi:hypothetical protein
MSVFAKANRADCLRRSLSFLTELLDVYPVVAMDSVAKEWNLNAIVEHQLVYEVSRTRLTPTGENLAQFVVA